MTSDKRPEPDLTAIAADDELLDLLGRGEPPPRDDKLAGLLATWRSDLTADEPADLDIAALLADLPEETDETAPLRPAVPEGEADADGDGDGGDAGDRDAGDAGDGDAGGGDVVELRPRQWRPSRYLTAAAAALLLITGLGVSAGFAGPDNPLWPVARVLYPERADVRLAEHHIAEARKAAADGRYADARRTLDKAAGSVERIDDRKLADRLRAQITEIRRTLPPTSTPHQDPTPSPSPTTQTPTPAAPQPTVTGGQTRQPGGGNTRQPGGDVIPNLPTPTLPIPIPTITIPGLPLNTR